MNVEEATCKARMEKVNDVKTDTKENTSKIVDLEKLMERVVTLIEGQNTRISVLEKRETFFESKIGASLIKMFMFLIVIVTLVAVGKELNLAEVLKVIS